MSVNALDRRISADKEKQILAQRDPFFRWLESAPGFNLCDILPRREFETKYINVIILELMVMRVLFYSFNFLNSTMLGLFGRKCVGFLGLSDSLYMSVSVSGYGKCPPGSRH